MITRSEGVAIPGWSGLRPGGGKVGATPELDAAVQHAAELLAAEFPAEDVEIRFNADRQSGGAFLKDESRGSLGISAGLHPDPSVFMEAPPAFSKFRRNAAAFETAKKEWSRRRAAAPKVIVFNAFVAIDRLADQALAMKGTFPDFYAHPEFGSAEDALAWIRANCVVCEPRVSRKELKRWEKRLVWGELEGAKASASFLRCVEMLGQQVMSLYDHGGEPLDEPQLAAWFREEKKVSEKDARDVTRAVLRLLPGRK